MRSLESVFTLLPMPSSMLRPLLGQSDDFKFGCRMLAYMAPKPYEGQDAFIRQCLVEGENALYRQSKLKPDELDSEHTLTWEQMVTNSLDLGDYKADGLQDDGWGFAVYESATGETLRIEKSEKPAATDPAFLAAAEAVAKSKPPLLLAHLREGPNPVLENAHPFRHGQFAFMHNGAVPGKIVAHLEKTLHRFNRRYGLPLPQGKTDSERVFHYMLGRLREETGTLDLDKLSTPQIRQVFGEVTQEILSQASRRKNPLAASLDKRIRENSGLIVDPDSRLRFPVGLNFILTDGNRIFAICNGRKLFLGFRKNTDGSNREILLASRRIQPSKASGEDPITWVEIPDGHLVTLERNASLSMENTENQALLQPSFRMDPLADFAKPGNRLNELAKRAISAARAFIQGFSEKLKSLVARK